MSEPGDTPESPAPDSAGAMLRAARQAQGLHIAALATMLKVPPRKLEALENDRYDELQGATFVRALAQAACRALKIDPTPVLDMLPDIDAGNLSQLERSLNAPFREKGTRRETSEGPSATRAVLGLVAVLLVGALAFLLVPKGWRLPSIGGGSAASAPGQVSEPASAGAVTESVSLPQSIPAPLEPASTPMFVPAPVASLPGAAAAPAPVVSPPASQATRAEPAPAPASVPASAASTVASASGQLLQLHARAASWVEVVDGHSKVLLSRTLATGESVGFDGALPMRVRIGNVAGTEVSFRGRSVDLAATARDNVARLELK